MKHSLINYLEHLNLCSIIIILIFFPEPQLALFTFLSNLHDETKTISSSPLIEKSNTDILSKPSPIVLSKSLSISNGLFFIRCIPEDIFKQQLETIGDYHVIFLARHPEDKHLCDDKSRW